MSSSAIFVTVVVVLLLVALIKEWLRPGLILFSGAVVFLCAGILSPSEVVAGFSNKGMITVALLFLVSEGVRRSGLLEKMLYRLLPSKRCGERKALFSMMPMVSFISAFLNNTPVVVIFAPMVKRWAERVGIPATKLLIPLSFATILGGLCTLIGTSTNLVVHGMALDEAAANPTLGLRGLNMFELGKIGLFLNDKKTVVLRDGQKKAVTGIVVNEKPNVSAAYRRKLRQELYFCRKHGVDEHIHRRGLDVSAPQYTMQLLGQVNYVLQITPDNAEMRQYKEWLTRELMRI